MLTDIFETLEMLLISSGMGDNNRDDVGFERYQEA